MRYDIRFLLAASALTLGASATIGVAAARPVQASQTPASSQRAVLDRYCVTCHNERLKTADLMLDTLDVTNVPTQGEVWEKVIRKLRAGLMPPAGRPRPDKATYEGLASWLESELDRHAAAHPNPGRTEPFHRLNRAEYQNAIRDLLGVEVDVTALLPADDASYGFDNIAGVLKMSATLLERYLSAAQKISRLAVGLSPPIPNYDLFRIADDLLQDSHVDGLPFGMRGGTRVRYFFPLDGTYEIAVRLQRDLMGDDVPFFTEDQRLELSVNGEQVHVFTLPATVKPRGEFFDGLSGGRQHIDENWRVRIPVKAGQRDVQLAFLNRTSALDSTRRLPFLRPHPSRPDSRQGAYLRSVEISGPYDSAGAGDTRNRRRIFICYPKSRPSEEWGCANTILSALARRAYRRPVTNADMRRLLSFYQDGREKGFDAGIGEAVKRLLISPAFLFRVERDPAGIAPNTPYRLTDLELASRLSFFLWSSIPDEELVAVAARGTLKDPMVLESQIRRMLADPRAEALVKNFTGQWLFLRNVPATGPNPRTFPDYDEGLRQAFRRETELFFESLLREDRSVLELLTANYTFVNERLAKHYGIPNVMGTRFRRVTLPDGSVRGGLLGQGSILTVTSYPNRTAPVIRGKWILENLLGTPPPPPPPNAPSLAENQDPGGAVLTMRQRMAQHRANPVCSSCHAVMEPVGLALENFDAVGRWRDRGDGFAAIDASGELADGTKFDGPLGLRQALLGKADRFVGTVTEKLLTYALGRGLDYYDMPAVRTIVRDAARNDYRFSSGLIVGIAKSTPFQMRRSADREAAATTAAAAR